MVHNDVQLMTDIQKIYEEEAAKIADVSHVLPVVVYQPISTAMTAYFTRNGGNALGITAADGLLTYVNLKISVFLFPISSYMNFHSAHVFCSDIRRV
jgi:hypothetical protein